LCPTDWTERKASAAGELPRSSCTKAGWSQPGRVTWYERARSWAERGAPEPPVRTPQAAQERRTSGGGSPRSLARAASPRTRAYDRPAKTEQRERADTAPRTPPNGRHPQPGPEASTALPSPAPPPARSRTRWPPRRPPEQPASARGPQGGLRPGAQTSPSATARSPPAICRRSPQQPRGPAWPALQPCGHPKPPGAPAPDRTASALLGCGTP